MYAPFFAPSIRLCPHPPKSRLHPAPLSPDAKIYPSNKVYRFYQRLGPKRFGFPSGKRGWVQNARSYYFDNCIRQTGKNEA